jgi:hypothetical protein
VDGTLSEGVLVYNYWEVSAAALGSFYHFQIANGARRILQDAIFLHDKNYDLSVFQNSFSREF